MSTLSDAEIARAERLCFFAHYHPQGLAAEHVLIYLRSLKEAGFVVVVSSTAQMAEAEQAKLRGACALLIMRENVGLDFGGWIEAYRRFSPITAGMLLFANDSVYAPVGNLGKFIDNLLAVPADFYGVIENIEQAAHLQSWFLIFRQKAYQSAAFKDLFSQRIGAEMSKHEIIRRFEVGLTEALTAAGLIYHASYRPSQNGLISQHRPFNASHLLWRSLIERGDIPFLKIELLRDNPLGVTDVENWSSVVKKYSIALLASISEDISLRVRPGGVGTERRWSDTLDEPNPAFWPELQGFIRRDYRAAAPNSRPTLFQRINARLYRAAAERATRKREAAGAFAGKEKFPAWYW